MPVPEHIFVTAERRVWMRRCDHTVVFDRDPHFERCLADPSGSVLRILRIWVAHPGAESFTVRRYRELDHCCMIGFHGCVLVNEHDG